MTSFFYMITFFYMVSLSFELTTSSRSVHVHKESRQLFSFVHVLMAGKQDGVPIHFNLKLVIAHRREKKIVFVIYFHC